ncbi:MAG: hypothetical protein IKV77_05095 [Alistipes sp.]|nr:hypothetical protein [Bacteroidales bacterium]MBR5492488.1 hypothetical protein [Alistipes sp.]MBR5920062.1 hypothetical protein [Bacteroidales bacterium]
MRLKTLINRVEKAREDMQQYVREACQREKQSIINYNRLQLRRGVNADGEMMNGGVYSDQYAAFRMRKGLPIDHVYLLLSGDLQDGMDVEFTNTGFSVVSTDWKQWMVEYTMETGSWPPGNKPQYGPVFGLDDTGKTMLAWKIKPVVARSLRRKLLN